MKIIYISGIDGCGKTIQAKLLVEVLKKKGVNVKYKWLRWEPALQKLYRFPQVFIPSMKKTKVVDDDGNVIKDRKSKENIEHSKWVALKKKLLSNYIFRKLWWFHACMDYYFQVRKRVRNLNKDVLVVDRYFYDFLIDQALNFDLLPEKCKPLMNNYFLKKFMVPDLTIFLDLPASVGYGRKLDGTSLDYLKEREQYYKNVSITNNVVYLDGTKSIESISKEIEKIVNHRIIKS